jgi:hypothetical protein
MAKRKSKKDNRYTSEEKVALIRELRDGLGPKSPSGKKQWTMAEIASHPQIDSSRQAVRQMLLRRGETPNQIESVEERKQKELDKISCINARLLDEIHGKDLSSTPVDKLAWTYGVLFDKREKQMSEAQEQLNLRKMIIDMNRQMKEDYKKRKIKHAEVIDVDATEVKDG